MLIKNKHESKQYQTQESRKQKNTHCDSNKQLVAGQVVWDLLRNFQNVLDCAQHKCRD